MLESKIKSKVTCGKIDIGLMGRIIINDLCVWDKNNNILLSASRVAAKPDFESIINGQISISTAQLFGFEIHLYKNTQNGPTNFQYIIDAFASKDKKTKKETDLRINSIMVRRGTVTYDLNYKPETPNRINPSHIALHDLSATISLKALRNDSINANIKKLSFVEKSGFQINKLSLKIEGNRQKAQIENFELLMPETAIQFSTIEARYNLDLPDFIHNVHLRGHIEPSYVVLSDIRHLIPRFDNFNGKLFLNTSFRGTIDNINLSGLTIHTENKDLFLQTDVELQHIIGRSPKKRISAHVAELDASTTGVRFLLSNLQKNFDGVPAPLTRLGNIRFTGNVNVERNNIYANGIFNTGLGQINTNVNITDGKSIAGEVRSPQFLIGGLINDQNLGNLAINANIKALLEKGKINRINIDGEVPFVEFKNYRYSNIALNGSYNKNDFNGTIDINDQNLSAKINGAVDLSRRIPLVKLTASLENFRPSMLNLTQKYAGTDFSANINADFTASNLDNVNGTLSIDGFSMVSPTKNYNLEKFLITAENDNKQKRLKIDSDFAEAEIVGQYSYKTIMQSIRKILIQSLPALAGNSKEIKSTNDFSFLVTVRNADLLNNLFDIPLEIREPIFLNGFFNDHDNRIQTLLLAPDFVYDGTSYRNTDISCNSQGNGLNYDIKVSRLNNKNKATNLEISGQGFNNLLQTKLSWNNTDTLNHTEGALNTVTHFFHNENEPVSAVINIEPSNVEIGDSIWNIRQSSINISNGRYTINNLSIEHKEQHLNFNGSISKEGNDSIEADLNEVNLEYIFDVLNFHPIELAGFATGKAYLRNLLTSPNATAHLYVRKFTFDYGPMGDMNLYGSYDDAEGNINLNAQMMEPALSTTTVRGFVSPKRNELDLRISANNSNLEFLHYYVGNIFPEIEGRGTGDVHIFGPLKYINIEGDVTASISASVKVLGTTYNLKNQKIHMVPDRMEFNNVTITDRDGHKGIVNGAVYHECLKHMRYKFNIASDGLLCYDFKEFGENTFYGTVYGAGNVELDGGPGYLNVDVNMQSRPKTLFVYNASQPDEITNQQFFSFVDHTKESADSLRKETAPTPINDEMDIRISGIINATEDATLRVIMDRTSGDHIQTLGNGNLHFSYYNKGRFNMYGTYTLESGVYKMSMQQVIHKDFRINRGGTVNFAGNPYDADLNVQAIYTVPSASLNDLAPGTTFNQNNVRVNCLMNIAGKARQPQVSFDLELPTMNEEERQLVNSVISTEEEKNTQIIYLLGVGRFYANDYNNPDGASQSTSAMNSLLSSTLSGQLNQILSQTINNNNWNIGANLSTGEHGWDDMDVEGILQGRLLNNRLLFNGNFGYRENSMTATTNNWIGDFDIQYLLTPNGSISLKGYNMTNDRYFTKATLTTQGIGIVFKKELNSWLDLFRFKKSSSVTDTLNSK